jgi:hypothetical protein
MRHSSHKLPIQELHPVVGDAWDRRFAPPVGRNFRTELDVSHCDPPGSGSPPTFHVLAQEARAEPAIPWTATDPPRTRGLEPPGWRESSGEPPGRITSRGDPPGSGSPPTAHAIAHEAQAEPAIPWSVTDPPTRAQDPPRSGSPPTAHAIAHVAQAEPAIPWSVTDPPSRVLELFRCRESSGSPPGRITSRGDSPGSGSPPTYKILAHVAQAEPAIPWSVTDPPSRVLELFRCRESSGSPPGRITSRGDPPGGVGIPINSLSAERRRGTLLVTRPEAVRQEAVRTSTPKSRKIRPWL